MLAIAGPGGNLIHGSGGNKLYGPGRTPASGTGGNQFYGSGGAGTLSDPPPPKTKKPIAGVYDDTDE